MCPLSIYFSNVFSDARRTWLDSLAKELSSNTAMTETDHAFICQVTDTFRSYIYFYTHIYTCIYLYIQEHGGPEPSCPDCRYPGTGGDMF